MTNKYLLPSAGVGNSQDPVANKRRRYIIGHVLRLATSRPASLVTDRSAEVGSKRWGRPERTWWDTFIEDMQEMSVSVNVSGTHGEVIDRDRSGEPKSKSK